MSETTAKPSSRRFRHDFLTGPIFGKELRVAGRKRRTYVLRSVYVLLLSMFTVLVWQATVSWESGVMGISRMAMAGKTIVTAIMWFQLFAMQLITVAILSSSVSDEIYHRTLGVLMTTCRPSAPITAAGAATRSARLFRGLSQSVSSSNQSTGPASVSDVSIRNPQRSAAWPHERMGELQPSAGICTLAQIEISVPPTSSAGASASPACQRNSASSSGRLCSFCVTEAYHPVFGPVCNPLHHWLDVEADSR